MTIKTFDANRVGGGTFSLEQDSLTGEYKLKEVGFVKLPTLKLPEIEQAAYKVPTPYTPDPDPDPNTGTGGGGSGGGGGDNQDQRTSQNFDYTGTKQYENIQKQATDIGKADMGAVSPRDRTDMNEGAIQIEGLREKTVYDKAVSNYNAIAEMNRDLAMGKQPLSTEQRLQNKADIDAARNQMDTARKNYEGTFETIKAAPTIADFSQGPRTVPTGTLTGAKVEDIGKTFRSDTEKFKTRFDPTEIEPATAKPKNVIAKAKDVLSNLKPVSVMIVDALSNAITSPQQQALNTANKNALSTVGYKTNFELGISTDPGRIAGNPANNVFAGMNAQSATGNVMTGSANRVKTRETVGIQRVEARYGKNSQKAKDFREKTQTFKDQRQEVLDAKEKEQAKINQQTMNQGPPSQSGGGGDPGCFIKGTLITMLDGSKKPVEKVDLGDNVAVGGKVFAVGRFLNTELYDYKGIKVSGSHMVNEDGTWLRVRDTKHGKSLGDDLNTVYVFGSENRRILIDDILFTDYFEVSEQDQLINNEEDFFNNWKSYGNTINEHNVNTLNAN